MKKYFSISKSVLLAVVLIATVSCNDTWNDHYSFKETESKYPVAKLAETLGGIDGFDKFCQAMATTRMCDKKGTPLNMTYMDLLNEDQFLTVWAPSNSSISDEDWARYTARDKSAAEHREVGEKFIQNHIARFKHSIGANSDERIRMINGKAYSSHADNIAGNPYHGQDMNIRCSNGVLHCIDGHMDYLPSIYEYITTSPQYKDILGDWFKSFTVEELDASRSVAQGINENGEMVYIDSVMVEYNSLMNRYGRVHSEDSVYAMILPTPELWDSIFNHIKPSFVYGEAFLNNDSLQQYYTRTTMMSDMFFNLNPKVQRYLPDSIFSTMYSPSVNRSEGKPYHIFGHPYDKVNGIFGACIDSVECSNGVIYFIDQWPFADTLSYVRTIKFEAENYTNLSGFSLRQAAIIGIIEDDPEQAVNVMRISMPGMSSWSAKMYIGNHLSGKYNVKMVFAPNLVDDMPNYIHPKITFDTPTMRDSVLADSSQQVEIVDKRGRKSTVTQQYYAINSMLKMDTFDLGTVFFPYSNYDMNQPRLAITLSSGVNEMNSSRYSSELWLDGIILEPVVE